MRSVAIVIAVGAVALSAPAVPVFILGAGGFGLGFLVFAWAFRPITAPRLDH